MSYPAIAAVVAMGTDGMCGKVRAPASLVSRVNYLKIVAGASHVSCQVMPIRFEGDVDIWANCANSAANRSSLGAQGRDWLS
jgi:hypothetical protein